MGDDNGGRGSSAKVQIVVALIGLVGVLGGAIFANWDKINPQRQSSTAPLDKSAQDEAVGMPKPSSPGEIGLGGIHTSPARLGYQMDINAYCVKHGFQSASNNDGTGYGWRCEPGDGNIDAQQLCKEQYGGGLVGRLTTPPPGGVNDWICVDSSR